MELMFKHESYGAMGLSIYCWRYRRGCGMLPSALLDIPPCFQDARASGEEYGRPRIDTCTGAKNEKDTDVRDLFLVQIWIPYEKDRRV